MLTQNHNKNESTCLASYIQTANRIYTTPAIVVGVYRLHCVQRETHLLLLNFRWTPSSAAYIPTILFPNLARKIFVVVSQPTRLNDTKLRQNQVFWGCFRRCWCCAKRSYVFKKRVSEMEFAFFDATKMRNMKEREKRTFVNATKLLMLGHCLLILFDLKCLSTFELYLL